jgi:hypothetical protein
LTARERLRKVDRPSLSFAGRRSRRPRPNGPHYKGLFDLQITTAAKLRATIERLEAVAADRDGPEADAYREKAAELRLELAVAEAAEGRSTPGNQNLPLTDIAKLTPAERAALEIELQQTFEVLEAEKRAIHEWESGLVREKSRMLRRRAEKAKQDPAR